MPFEPLSSSGFFLCPNVNDVRSVAGADFVNAFSSDPRERGICKLCNSSQTQVVVEFFASCSCSTETVMPKNSHFAPAVLTMLLASAGSAQAAIQVYTTQASYLAAINAPGIDSFDDLDPSNALDTPQTRTPGAYQYTVSVGPSSNFFPAGTLGGDVWLSGDDPTDTITFDNFSPNVRGLGGFFFRTGLDGQLTTVDATFNFTATDASGAYSLPLVNPSTTSFIGFVSTGPLSNVKAWVGVEGFGVTDLFISANDLTLGAAAPIPEPETYALMLGGLALLGAAVRRKKA
jgi:hypothetical protein